MSTEVFPHCIVTQSLDTEISSLAESLGLECVDEQVPLPDCGFVLRWGEDGLALQQLGKKAPNPVKVDFARGAVDHRRKFGGGSGQMIAKAVGVKMSRPLKVLDATAGLGKDAFVLASLGCQLQLHERNPVVYALLADGLQRALRCQDVGLVDVVGRMQLLACDSLSVQVPEADVVYLDPMFPERSKSASVKKDMAIFHSIVGGDEDADGLLQQALGAAKYRVVVKRPKKAPFLNQQAPSYQLTGKTSRYDIYVNAKLPG
ncbi:MAG: SAM-dependent methyltransferase [Cellvibrionaceae bacterium]|nr:SAM-dependent methyltransferase [Cellvibrionaceae bacterium]|tara:strand:+ start:135 stop:914 length:780 start_codon:yes stop_codon:yes gene_type:complete